MGMKGIRNKVLEGLLLRECVYTPRGLGHRRIIGRSRRMSKLMSYISNVILMTVTMHPAKADKSEGGLGLQNASLH